MDNPPWVEIPARNPYGLFDMNRWGGEEALGLRSVTTFPSSPLNPGAYPNRFFWQSEVYYYDLYQDEWLSDGERDEDADGLTNYDETHGRMTQKYWAECYARAALAHPLRADQPRG